MIKKYEILNKILNVGIIAVIRGESIKEGKRISEACLKGGIEALEITYTLPGATEIIKDLKNENHNDKIIVGAGTVLDQNTARFAILAGADFIVSPSFDENTAKICNLYQIPYIPGCMTVNEITKALETGVDIIKLFPANNFEYNFIKSLKGPFPNINIMATGGIDLNNLETWFKNGVSVVGAGGKLASGSSKDIISTAKNFIKKITELKIVK